jgi:hypothetical protein
LGTRSRAPRSNDATDGKVHHRVSVLVPSRKRLFGGLKTQGS